MKKVNISMKTQAKIQKLIKIKEMNKVLMMEKIKKIILIAY